MNYKAAPRYQFGNMTGNDARIALILLLLGGALLLAGIAIPTLTMPKVMAIVLGAWSVIHVIGCDHQEWKIKQDNAREETRMEATRVAYHRIKQASGHDLFKTNKIRRAPILYEDLYPASSFE